MTHTQKNKAILWKTCEEQYKQDLTFRKEFLELAGSALPQFFKKWNVGFDIKETLGVTEFIQADKPFKTLTQYSYRLKRRLKAEHGSHEASAGKCMYFIIVTLDR